MKNYFSPLIAHHFLNVESKRERKKGEKEREIKRQNSFSYHNLSILKREKDLERKKNVKRKREIKRHTFFSHL